MYRVLKEEVLKDLPPKRHQVIWLDKSKSSVQRLLDWVSGKSEVSRGSAFDTAIEEVKRIKGPGFEELSEVRKIEGLGKVADAIKHIELLMESVDKLVVFGWHQEVLEKIHAAVEGSVLVTGKTPLTKRQDAVDRFQNSKDVKVFIGNIKAAGVGLTLTAASTVLFVEHSYVPADMQQAADRCHRIGQANPVLVQYLVREDSLDGAMLCAILDKIKVIDKCLDMKEVTYES
jgi:SWI/SNF-related matrix-associated actin-dependent regulator 1 of chromatin subfamily A